MLPTLEGFLKTKQNWPKNSYVRYPGFKNLYVRKGDIGVQLNGEEFYRCTNVVTIASVDAARPGKGAFTGLVKHLVDQEYAIYVENVHNERFRVKLKQLGFVKVNEEAGPNYLLNFDGHLVEWERNHSSD